MSTTVDPVSEKLIDAEEPLFLSDPAQSCTQLL
jgi:hypothetical protein